MLQFNEQVIKQIADYLQNQYQQDIINLQDDQHRNKVRDFLLSKGYPYQ